MLIDFILLFLFAGVPYFVFFEKTKLLGSDKIFIFAVLSLIVGMTLSCNLLREPTLAYIVIAFISSLYTYYKAKNTTNLYKLSYYILFFNSPLLIMFESKERILYGISLLVTLIGVFLMGKYYERSYGSANYRSVSGITLVTPYAGLILTMYFTALALYPPFPNALLFLNGILKSEINMLWYIVVAVIFFGNFLIAARVMAKTVFGKPNDNLHYIDVSNKEKFVHLLMFIILVVLSIVALEELL